MTSIDWAIAGQIAVGIVIGAVIIAAIFAHRAAKADEADYRDRRFVS